MRTFRGFCLALATLIALAVLPAFTPPTTAAGSQYYVDSQGGSDGNDGTSPGAPWRTLAEVTRHDFAPGDVINLKRGSTWDSGVVLRSSGTSGSPITVQPYGDGPRPVVSYPNVEFASAVTVEGSYISVQGLLIRDTHAVGVYVARGADHNLIADNEIANVGSGVTLLGQQNLVRGNYIHDGHMIRNTPGGDDDFGANGVIVEASNNEVAGNRFERCLAPSYDYGTDGGAVEIFGKVDNVSIQHNYSTQGNGFIEVGGSSGSVSNLTVAYNVSAGDIGSFTTVHLAGHFAVAIANFRVDNNTIVRPTKEYRLLSFQGDPSPGTFLFRNNVVYSSTPVSDNAEFTHENNIYFLSDGADLGFRPGPGEKIADPLFVDLRGGNYRLRAGSPAVNAGKPLGYTRDFDGNAVPAGSAPDAGAFQSVSAPPRFVLGFATLAALIPDVAGQPLEDEHYGPNGDSLQRTTTGLMVWRKADNWTAFTNGSQTWINGPEGLVQRANSERFPWESDAP